MQDVIRVVDLTKQYKDRIVVNDVSLTVKKGEVYGLLGHNGAGKSTTIDCILGLREATKGSCEILGMKAQKNRHELFQKVGVQLQHSSFQNNIKVNELCQEMSSLYKNPEDYQTLLKLFQLHEYADQKVEQLSGGEKQKLSVVIALLSKPEVLFLDELTTGLDVAARRDVWQILLKLKEQGMTIFLTTHYMEEASKLCDRIMILREGKTVVEGSVASVVKQSPYDSLEEAYLWYVKEEDVL